MSSYIPIFVEVDSRRLNIVAGVIRRDVSSWRILSDSGHEPIGLKSVQSITDTKPRIRVNFEKRFNKVISFSVTPDEAYAPLFRIGASVSFDYTDLYVYDNSGMLVNPLDPRLLIPYSNFWVQGFFY
jgi:hypothetical protein